VKTLETLEKQWEGQFDMAQERRAVGDSSSSA